MRLSAVYTTEEIAALCEAERDSIKQVSLPRFGGRVTTNWVSAKLQEFRAELYEVSD